MADCLISGVITDVQGVPVGNVAVHIVHTEQSGVISQVHKKTVATSSVVVGHVGEVSFVAPRGSNIWLRGNFYIGSRSFNTISGISRTVPDTPTADLGTLGDPVTLTALGQPLDSQLTAIAALANAVGFLRNDGAGVMSWAAASGGTWGSISGTLSAQTDLQTALNLKGDSSGTLAQFAATTSLELKGVISDETGSGALVFATSPALTTPDLGVAVATSINKVALTQPATAATLTIVNNKTLTVNKSLTLEGTDSTVMTFPTTSATIARTDAGNAFIGNQTIAVGQTTSAQTDLLINPSTKASGNFVDFQVAGVSKFSVNNAGNIVNPGSIVSQGAITSATAIIATAGNYLRIASNLNIFASADGMALLQNSTVNGLRGLSLGATSPSTIGAAPVNGETFTILQAMELLTIAASPTSTTTMLIPANAVVLGVAVRCTVSIPTAASFTVKIGATTFNTAAVSSTAPSTDPGTLAGAWFNATAQGVIVTPNATPGTNAGRVRVTVMYYLVTPPTS